MDRKICVIGLGYVGLPLAILLSEKGYTVFGFDTNLEKVNLIRKGISPINDEYLISTLPKVVNNLIVSDKDSIISLADVVVVCVPTPIDENHRPDLGPLISASKSISKNMREGQLISIESTIAPGTCRKIIQPILEESKLLCDKNFYMVHCPERFDLGNKTFSLKDLPRVLGSTSKEGLEKGGEFYSSFLEKPPFLGSSIEVAEASKIIENTFRDINIAFVNELAKSFGVIGIDTFEVIRAASTKPFAFLPHYPGIGVGGHCIGVDPYYLIDAGESVGYSHSFLKLARDINKSMPLYTVEKIAEGLNEVGKSINETKITILGVAYKPNVDDHRESPSLEIIKELKKRGARVLIYDPYLPQFSNTSSLDDALKTDCVVLCTAHDGFKEITPQKLVDSGVKVVVDGRNFFDKESILKAGMIYRGIGK